MKSGGQAVKGDSEIPVHLLLQNFKLYSRVTVCVSLPCRACCGAELVTGVAPAPVVNGCEQRGRGLLGGLCPQPWQKASHQKTGLESQSGNRLSVAPSDAPPEQCIMGSGAPQQPEVSEH